MVKQLLIESCNFSFNVTQDKTLTESIKLNQGKNDTLIVRNVPSTILDRKNLNGRIYPTKVMQKAIDEAKPAMERRELNSQACEHPSDSSNVTPSNVSHTVISAYIKNVEIEVDGKKERHNVLFTDWLIPATSHGKDLMALLLAGISVPVSIRGLGDVDNNNVVTEYEFLGVDCVSTPSSSVHSTQYVSESVQISKAPITETFIVSASATDVLRDLDNALQKSAEIDRANFGTISKTSTKLDTELDKKTGAETTLITLETETNDEVSDLNQALQMVQNILTNPVTSVDSVTIENVKEEQPQESVENAKEDKKELAEVAAGPISAEYAAQKNMFGENAKEDKKDSKVGRKFILKCPNGFVAMDGNALVFKDDPKEALHFIEGKEESGLVHLSGVEKILDTMGVYDVEKYFRKPITDISASDDEVNEGFTGAVLGGVAGSLAGDAALGATLGDTAQDALTDESMQEGVGGAVLGGLAGTALGHPILGAAAGSLLQDKWKSGKPKDTWKAGAVLGGAAGSLIGQPIAGAAIGGAIQNAWANKKEEAACGDCAKPDEQPITEGNTRYEATVTIQNNNGTSTDTIPVSGVDVDAVNSEVANLYDMKAQKAEQGLTITVTDSQTGQKLMFNPETRTVEPMQEQAVQEAAGDLEQDGNKLSMEVDDDNKVEKEFASPAQASVVKAGLEQGKLNGNVMLDEGSSIEIDLVDWDEANNTGKLQFFGPEADLNNIEQILDDEIWMTWIEENDGSKSLMTCYAFPEQKLNQITRRLQTNGVKLSWKEADLSIEEATPQYTDIEPGWYAGAENVGVTGPYESREALEADLADVLDYVTVEYISPEDLGMIPAAESAKMDEVLFTKPGKPSDPEVKEPMTDAVADTIDFKVSNIDYADEYFCNNADCTGISSAGLAAMKKAAELPDELIVKVPTSVAKDDIVAYIDSEIEKQTGIPTQDFDVDLI